MSEFLYQYRNDKRARNSRIQRAIARYARARAVVIAVCLMPVSALAQDTTHARVDTLSSVRVTVLRTPFDLSAIPFAVNVVTARDGSAARPGFSLAEVLNRVPGVQVNDRLNFALGDRISIRGLGARAQFGVRGIRFIVDGIPATLADGQTVLNNVDLASFGTAEVLRGPASTVYGNASGGVVILESATPPAQLFAPRVQFVTGSNGLRHGQIGAAGSQGAWHYSLTGDQLNYGGYRAFSNAKNTHGNGVFTYDAERVQVKLVVNGEHHNAQNPGGLSDSLLRIDRQQAFANNVAQQTGERGTQVQTGTSARIQLPVGELRLGGYLLQRTLDNPIPPSIISLSRHAGGMRAAYGVAAGAPGQSATAMVGIESDIQHDDRENYVNTRGVNGALTLNQQEHVTSTSPFMQVTGSLGAATAFGGIRYDRFRFAVADRLITPSNPDDSGVRHLSAWSPALGLSYRIQRLMTVYVNATTAFQTPTTTELANRPDGAGGFNPLLDPERTHSVEAGVHGVMGGRATYQASVYRMRITGELIPFQVPLFAGRTFYRNAAVAEHRGVELDERIVLTSQLSAHLSYAYINAYIVADTTNGGANVGKRVAGIAPHRATAALDAGQTDSWFATAEVRAEGATPVNNTNAISSPTYAVMNLRASSPPIAAGAAIFGGVGNVFGRRYNTSVVINAVGGRYFEPAAGRTFYLGGTWTLRR